jgi:hypothetical protein
MLRLLSISSGLWRRWRTQMMERQVRNSSSLVSLANRKATPIFVEAEVSCQRGGYRPFHFIMSSAQSDISLPHIQFLHPISFSVRASRFPACLRAYDHPFRVLGPAFLCAANFTGVLRGLLSLEVTMRLPP